MGISRLLGAAKLQSAPVADNPLYAAGKGHQRLVVTSIRTLWAEIIFSLSRF